MKKILSLIFFCVIILSALSGCTAKYTPANSQYDFTSYESDNLYDIEQVSLSGELSKSCVSYKFTYLSDYCEVKGYISLPLDCIKNSTPAKCILYNRGGNSNIGLLSDESTAVICASTNRIVIASQYRGADGGTGNDEFGGKDLNDVKTLIDMCENTFKFADMNDFCIAGVSRGGMMSYMTARTDSRIKGIIAISAVSDLEKAYEEREDMKNLLQNSIGGSPTDLPDEYEKRSAICWADEIKVPVLMIHSKLDEMVPYSQAESLNAEFEKNNLDCTFITYDDDVHGLHNEDAEKINNWIEKTFG